MVDSKKSFLFGGNFRMKSNWPPPFCVEFCRDFNINKAYGRLSSPSIPLAASQNSCTMYCSLCLTHAIAHTSNTIRCIYRWPTLATVTLLCVHPHNEWLVWLVLFRVSSFIYFRKCDRTKQVNTKSLHRRSNNRNWIYIMANEFVKHRSKC